MRVRSKVCVTGTIIVLWNEVEVENKLELATNKLQWTRLWPFALAQIPGKVATYVTEYMTEYVTEYVIKYVTEYVTDGYSQIKGTL